MDVFRPGTNLHCPKCGNDIIFITESVSSNYILNDKRILKCYWPKCGWNGRYCDLVTKEVE